MKKLILCLWTLCFLGCQKENITPVALNTESIEPPCYTTTDLSSFLSQYGTIAADIIPIVPGDYFQDANCNIAKWVADTRIRNIDGVAIDTDLEPVSISWTLDNDLPIVTESEMLPFYTYIDGLVNTDCPGIFQPTCNGSHQLQIQMHFADGTIYNRTGTAYGQVNSVPEIVPTCELEPSDYEASDLNFFDFECFCPIQFEPYEFLVQGLEWDLNNDGSVNTADLNIFLAGFGNC